MVAFEPQAVAQAAQERIALCQGPVVPSPQKAQFPERFGRAEGVPPAQFRMFMPETQLQHLHQELHVDQPAAPGLHVEAGAVLPRQLPLHAHAQPVDLAQVLVAEVVLVGEAFGDGLGLGAEPRVTGHETGADQRLPFPQLGAGLVVAAERFEGGDQGSRPSRGAQPHVELIGDAFRGRRRKTGDEPLPQLHVVLVGAETPAGLGAVGSVVEEDEVEVGVVFELRLAELAHGQHREAPGLQGAVAAVRFAPRQLQGRLQAGLRQSGQLRDGFGEAQLAAEIVEAQPDELLGAVASQAVEAVLGVRGFRDGCVQLVQHFGPGLGDAGEVHPDQAVEQLGPVHEQHRQETAVGEQIDEQARGTGVLRQQ